MFDRRSTTLRIVLFCAGFLIVAALVLGTGRGSGAYQSREAFVRSFGECMIPRVQITEVDGMIARFDSKTGAVHVLHGDLERGSGRVQWLRHVHSVGASTSGVLDLHTVNGTRGNEMLLLVDVVHGDTWVMRDRNRGASWQRIGVRR